MTDNTALRATEPAQVGDADRAFELWFFRDIVDDQRSKLIALMLGGAVAKEATNHGTQRLCLKYILKALRTQGRAADQPPELLERVAKIIAPHLEGGRDFDQMPPDRIALRKWCREGMCSTNDATQDDALEVARAVAPVLIAHGRELEKAEVAKRFDHIRSDLNNISRAIEDEGDRCYFGSTNDPDELRRVACDFEDWLLREERNEHKSNEHRRKP